MNTNNLKPFNLEQAKAGAPVVTRDGRPARIVCWDRKQDGFELFGFAGSHDYHIICWDLKGVAEKCLELNYVYPLEQSDLFMAPVERTVWVNLYRTKSGDLDLSSPHQTKENAEESRINYDREYIGTFPITFQE